MEAPSNIDMAEGLVSRGVEVEVEWFGLPPEEPGGDVPSGRLEDPVSLWQYPTIVCTYSRASKAYTPPTVGQLLAFDNVELPLEESYLEKQLVTGVIIKVLRGAL